MTINNKSINNKLNNTFNDKSFSFDCFINYGYYVTGLSLITPPLIGYNIKKLYNPTNDIPWIKGSCKMIPKQLILRSGQLLFANQLKESTNNTFIAFAGIGITQGIIYGHCTSNWLKWIKLPFKISPNPLAGFGYAAMRDIISQGIPFYVGQNINNKLDNKYTLLAVSGTSLVSTVASQGLHNCQTIMQIKNVGYKKSAIKCWNRHGFKMLYVGCEARICMMLGVNILNYLFLRDIWK
tara:strand:+ start:2027 stop:2740 length:714 start_codon:yes stop_codon:yes gene_type:complete